MVKVPNWSCVQVVGPSVILQDDDDDDETVKGGRKLDYGSMTSEGILGISLFSTSFPFGIHETRDFS